MGGWDKKAVDQFRKLARAQATSLGKEEDDAIRHLFHQNWVNKEPNQEPGSVLFLKRKTLILGQTKNLLVEPGTSSYLPGTY